MSPVDLDAEMQPQEAFAETVVGVLGLGLIGGSLAKGWADRGGTTIGWSRSAATREQAASYAGLEVLDSIAAVVERADIVVLATPLSVLADTVDEVTAASRRRDQLPTVTDVGSVKGAITSHARQVLPDPSAFVPGHPMAGTERAGWASSDGDLFGNARWALALDHPVALDRWVQVTRMVNALDAQVLPVTVEEHDRAVALISHLPYAVAAGLAGLLDAEQSGLASSLVAGSFTGATRVVAGDGRELGVELTRANAGELLDRLDGFQVWLAGFRSALAEDDLPRIQAAFRIPGAGPATRSDGFPPPEFGLPLRATDRAALLDAGRAGYVVTDITPTGGLTMVAVSTPMSGAPSRPPEMR